MTVALSLSVAISALYLSLLGSLYRSLYARRSVFTDFGGSLNRLGFGPISLPFGGFLIMGYTSNMHDEKLSEAEIERRREAALRRILNKPPTKHAPTRAQLKHAPRPTPRLSGSRQR